MKLFYLFDLFRTRNLVAYKFWHAQWDLSTLTTRFEEVKMSDDKSFDSFYGRLNVIVIAKLNLGEKIEDAKVVRKILRSLPESFKAKVIAIEESKDLDEIKI